MRAVSEVRRNQERQIAYAESMINLAENFPVAETFLVLAEMPSYIGVRSVFTMHDAKILGVPMESDGISLDIAEESPALPGGTRLAFVRKPEQLKNVSRGLRKRKISI